MTVTINTAPPIFGGQLFFWWGVQGSGDPFGTLGYPLDPAFDPTDSGNFTDWGASPAYASPDPTTTYAPAGFLDVPGLANDAVMDDIFPLGTFVRQQRNIMDYTPSGTFQVAFQDITLLSEIIRSGTGNLPFLTFIVGNATYARIVTGAKLKVAKITIPRNGRVTVDFSYDALLIQPLASAPPAISYTPLRVYYGYNTGLVFNGTEDYSQYISQVSISINQTMVRLPPIAVQINSVWSLVSQYLKETNQMIDVSFDCYNNLPQDLVNAIAVTGYTVTVPMVDYTNATRSATLTLTDLKFSTEGQSEGGMQAIVNFTARADAQNIAVAQVAAT